MVYSPICVCFDVLIWIVIITWIYFIYRCYKVRWTDEHTFRCLLNSDSGTQIVDSFMFYTQKKDYNSILLSSGKAKLQQHDKKFGLWWQITDMFKPTFGKAFKASPFTLMPQPLIFKFSNQVSIFQSTENSFNIILFNIFWLYFNIW